MSAHEATAAQAVGGHSRQSACSSPSLLFFLHLEQIDRDPGVYYPLLSDMQESGEEVTPSAAAIDRLPSFSFVYNDLFSVEKGPVSCRSNCLNTTSSSVGTITANGDMGVVAQLARRGCDSFACLPPSASTCCSRQFRLFLMDSHSRTLELLFAFGLVCSTAVIIPGCFRPRLHKSADDVIHGILWR